jgi:hypothetical protein
VQEENLVVELWSSLRSLSRNLEGLRKQLKVKRTASSTVKKSFRACILALLDRTTMRNPGADVGRVISLSHLSPRSLATVLSALTKAGRDAPPLPDGWMEGALERFGEISRTSSSATTPMKHRATALPVPGAGWRSPRSDSELWDPASLLSALSALRRIASRRQGKGGKRLAPRRDAQIGLIRSAQAHVAALQLQQLCSLVLGVAALCSDVTSGRRVGGSSKNDNSCTLDGGSGGPSEKGHPKDALHAAIDKLATSVIRRWRLLSSVRRRFLAQLPKGARARRSIVAVIPGSATPAQAVALALALVSSSDRGGLGARLSKDDAEWLMRQVECYERRSCRSKAERALFALKLSQSRNSPLGVHFNDRIQ